MSRLTFYGLDGYRLGELHAPFDRGLTIAGHASVVNGGSSTVTLTAVQASQPWLQLGRMVLVEPEKLPRWAGVIDTPWEALAPVQLTIYNAEYLLSLRTPDVAEKLEVPLDALLLHLLDGANGQEDLFVRQGDADESPERVETIDTRNTWDQLVEAVERAGQELTVRPEIQDGRLYLYLDTLLHTGKDTQYLFHSGGTNANMQVQQATVWNQVWNRVIGTSDLQDGTGKLTTDPMIDEDSLRYRLRSTQVQFENVREQSTLDRLTRAYLDANCHPKLRLQVRIEDVGEAFNQVGMGNTAIFHVPQLYLPGGIRGWRGIGRMLAISYEEKTNSVGLTVEADL